MSFLVMEEAKFRELFDGLSGQISCLTDEVAKLASQVGELTEVGVDDREVYYVKDVAELTGLKPETIRKNYISTGKIKTIGKQHRELMISRSEYWRVVNQWKREGVIDGHA